MNPNGYRSSKRIDRIDSDDERPTDTRRTIHGVDFSGAHDAGRKIWIASAVVKNGLRVERCRSVESVVGTAERDIALAYLREFLADEHRAVCGLDFSFSVPREVTNAMTWRAFVGNFAFESVEDMVDTYVSRTREYTDGERTYLKRVTDTRTGASSPYGFIVASQTFYGIRDVLRPLTLDERVSVLPMDEASKRSPWLCESYPAATLRELGLPDERYKNDRKYPRARGRRERILAGLREAGVTVADEEIAERAIADSAGDALDSVVAAFAAFRALRDGRVVPSDSHDERRRIEGHIYV